MSWNTILIYTTSTNLRSGIFTDHDLSPFTTLYDLQAVASSVSHPWTHSPFIWAHFSLFFIFFAHYSLWSRRQLSTRNQMVKIKAFIGNCTTTFNNKKEKKKKERKMWINSINQLTTKFIQYNLQKTCMTEPTTNA